MSAPASELSSESLKRPRPTIDPDSREFWRAAGNGILELSRCTACGRWEHPPRENCTDCGAVTHMEPSAGIGVVYSYIVVHHNTIPGFADVLPFAIALVEFEDGCRLPARVTGEYDRETLIGSTVRAEFERLAPNLAPALLVRVAAFRGLLLSLQ
jgi:uncharacterized OB-fold protein